MAAIDDLFDDVFRDGFGSAAGKAFDAAYGDTYSNAYGDGVGDGDGDAADVDKVDDLVFSNPHLIRAQGYFDLGMHEEAHRELDLADEVHALRMAVTIRRLDLYLAQKDWARAAIYGEVLCDLDPDEPRYFAAYATALHRLGRKDDALAVLDSCPLPWPHISKTSDHR